MNKAATILLAEDNADDVVLMKLAFKKAGLTNPVHVVSNGSEAIEYLKGALEAKSTGCAIPLLISLDLGMPICNGFEVLAWIKKKPELEHVPVLILSQSERPKDINRANNLGANTYLVKPANFQGLVGIIGIFKKMLEQVEAAELPRKKLRAR
jgi:CheY-like chemotaxis protein